MPDCPPRATLERFLAGRLDEGEEEDLCVHVEGCSACQGELDEPGRGPIAEAGAG